MDIAKIPAPITIIGFVMVVAVHNMVAWVASLVTPAYEEASGYAPYARVVRALMTGYTHEHFDSKGYLLGYTRREVPGDFRDPFEPYEGKNRKRLSLLSRLRTPGMSE